MPSVITEGKNYQSGYRLSGPCRGPALDLRPFIAGAGVQPQGSAHGIYDGSSGFESGFSPSTSVFPHHCHSTNARYSFIYQRRCIILATDSVFK